MTTLSRQTPTDLPTLSISPEKVCYLAATARRFDVKDMPTIPDRGSNPADEGMLVVLEDLPDDPVLNELLAFFRGLNIDEEIDLIALAWLGRGDGEIAEWDSLRAEAATRRNLRTAAYLLGMPLLADHLQEALAAFDLSCQEFEMGRM